MHLASLKLDLCWYCQTLSQA